MGGHGGNGRRNASHAAATRSTTRSAKRRPTSCTPIGRPSEVVVQGTLIAGWPDMLNGTVNEMCSNARAGSPADSAARRGTPRPADRQDEHVQLANGIAHGDAHRVHLAETVEDLGAGEAGGGLHPRANVRKHAGASLGRKANPVAVAAHPPETVKAVDHLRGDQRLHRLDVPAGAIERGSGAGNGVRDLRVDGQARSRVPYEADAQAGHLPGELVPRHRLRRQARRDRGRRPG